MSFGYFNSATRILIVCDYYSLGKSIDASNYFNRASQVYNFRIYMGLVLPLLRSG